MRLLLVRHAETVDNVGRILAGTTNSPLTNHGASQIDRLGEYLKSEGVYFTHVFASDLSRAVLTAEGICRHQPHPDKLAPLSTPLIRERDFGSFEGQKWSASYQSQAVQVMPETDQSIMLRANAFINDYVLPLILDESSDKHVVAVVSHGITLQFLWKCIQKLFQPDHIRLAPGASSHGTDARFVSPTWTNTAFLDLEINQSTASLPPHLLPLNETSSIHADPTSLLSSWMLDIRAINSRAHLTQLRRVQGGIGSGTFDQRQQKIDHFFRK
ncbi:histidine phosphatase superfamily [Aspergillus ambiguus]|uniref:phosphoglycerate mutase n=1 Tax=Aspergillus ambiguus TaxID=176160 RepID=UPI003CCCE06E